MFAGEIPEMSGGGEAGVVEQGWRSALQRKRVTVGSTLIV